MTRKIALALGAVVIIGVIIALLTGTIQDTLDKIWNWIFEDQLKIKNPPPSPFASLNNSPVHNYAGADIEMQSIKIVYI